MVRSAARVEAVSRAGEGARVRTQEMQEEERVTDAHTAFQRPRHMRLVTSHSRMYSERADVHTGVSDRALRAASEALRAAEFPARQQRAVHRAARPLELTRLDIIY